MLPLVGLLALATPLAPVALLCWWLVVTGEMPGTTWVRRAIAGLVTTYSVTAAVLTSLAVLDIRSAPSVLLALLLLGGLTARVVRQPRKPAGLLDRADAWSLGLAAATFLALYVPLVGQTTGRVMALLSRTTDAGTHLLIVSAIQRYGGYLQLSAPSGMSAGADHYPSAWHGNLWLVARLSLGDAPTVGQQTRLLALGAVFTYTLLAMVAASVVMRARTRPGPLPAVLALGPLTLSFVLGFGLFLPQLGSYTQAMALVAVLTAALVLPEARRHPRRVLTVLGACSIALMQSWYLLMPLMVAVLLVAGRRVRARPAELALAVLVVGPLCLYPVVTGPAASQLDLPGPVLLPTILGVLALLAVSATGCLAALRQEEVATRALLAATVASLLCCAGLVAREGVVPGEPFGYYASKLLLTTLLLGVVLGCAAALRSAPAGTGGRRAAVVVSAVLLGSALGTWSTRSDTLWPSTNPHADRISAVTLESLSRRHPRDRPAGTFPVVLDGCDRVWDRVATKWAYDGTVSWTPPFAAALVEHSLSRTGDVTALRAFLRRPDVRRLEVYVHRVCDPAALTQLATSPKVQVIRVP